MSANHAPRIAIAPRQHPAWMEEAVRSGGGQVVDVESAEGLIWADPREVAGLEELLRDALELRWVQLPWAGVEHFSPLFDRDRIWTCGKGVYAEPVAELALTLTLAGFRGLNKYVRATTWEGPVGRNLHGAQITIVGGGGIAHSLLRRLAPFGAHITVVRHRVADMELADVVLESDRLVDGLAGADAVILALALTPETDGLISSDELRIMEPHAWLVNVARGRHIVTDDLVDALRDGRIGGAALDVTDPEPLPDGHPLWGHENCIITPHVGNTPEMAIPLLSERISTNVRRFARGKSLIGQVDVELGY